WRGSAIASSCRSRAQLPGQGPPPPAEPAAPRLPAAPRSRSAPAAVAARRLVLPPPAAPSRPDARVCRLTPPSPCPLRPPWSLPLAPGRLGPFVDPTCCPP